MVLDHKYLTPNYALRSAIEDWKQENEENGLDGDGGTNKEDDGLGKSLATPGNPALLPLMMAFRSKQVRRRKLGRHNRNINKFQKIFTDANKKKLFFLALTVAITFGTARAFS